MTTKISEPVQQVELGGIYAEIGELYASLYRQLSAPDWAAHNLDGLFDVLTAELKEKTHIVWKGYDLVLDRYFTDHQKIADVISDAAKENPVLELVLESGNTKDKNTV